MNLLGLYSKLDEAQWPSSYLLTEEEFHSLYIYLSLADFIYFDDYSYGVRIRNHKKGIFTILRVQR